MSDHYYSKQPQSAMKTETRIFTLRNHSLTLTMGTGVFSKTGIDFGSKTLIEAFQAPMIDGDFLDLGCGYGPIGLALAKDFRDRQIAMVDINERAITLAQHNAVQNELENAHIIASDGFRQLENKKFAAIITNPPIRAGKKLVYQLLQTASAHLVQNGELWVVVQKKQGAPTMISFLETCFGEVNVITRKKGYFIIQAIKKI